MEDKETVLGERAIRRHSASGYSAGLIPWRDLIGWLQKYAEGGVRSGRLTADLVVTMEAFDDMPGDDIQQFRNGQGEYVYRKKVRAPGASHFEVRLLAIEEPDEDSFYVSEPNEPLRRRAG